MVGQAGDVWELAGRACKIEGEEVVSSGIAGRI